MNSNLIKVMFPLILFLISNNAKAGDKFFKEICDRINLPLVHAICIGDISEVKKLIAQGADVNTGDPSYFLPPLAFAAWTGRQDIVREILQSPHLDFKSQFYSSFLRALYGGAIEIVRDILADPRADLSGQDVLRMVRLYSGKFPPEFEIEAIKIILSHPTVDLNSASSWMNAPFWLSYISTNFSDDVKGNTIRHAPPLEAVKLIVSDPRIKKNVLDSNGSTVLQHFAESYGSFEHSHSDGVCADPAMLPIMHFLLQDLDFPVNSFNKLNRSVLESIFFGCGGDSLKWLLQRPDINVNIRDSKGSTPLIKIAQNVLRIPYYTHFEDVEMMIKDSRFDVNAEDSLGRTALFYGLNLNDPYYPLTDTFQFTATLLNTRKDLLVNHTDKKGLNFLAYYLKNQFHAQPATPSIVDAIVARKDFDVNFRGPDNKPLFLYFYDVDISSISKNLPILKALIKNRSDLQINATWGYPIIIHVLRDYADYGNNSVLTLLAERPDLIVNQKIVTGVSNFQQTYTTIAREAGEHEVWNEKLFHRSDFDINFADDRGRTYLHALPNGGYHTLEVLKKVLALPGINVNARDEDGVTPLKMRNDPAMRALLIEAGGIE